MNTETTDRIETFCEACRAFVISWIATILMLLLIGCVTVTRNTDGTIHATATGNGFIVMQADGSVKALASQSAESYEAFGSMAGNIIGTAVKASVKP